jgi:hypothetical protein
MTVTSDSGRRRLTMVKGYHVDIARPTASVKGHLENRFALVLDTQTEGSPILLFRLELFAPFIGAMLQVVPHEWIAITMFDGAVLGSFKAACDELRSRPINKPPVEMFLFLEGELVCVVNTEFWVSFGGPDPYHDSYTFSFYTREDLSESFRQACERVAAGLPNVTLEYVEALPRESELPPSRWQRLLRFLWPMKASDASSSV